MYQCSNIGNIKALRREYIAGNHKSHCWTKEKILKPTIKHHGYKQVKLSVNGIEKMFAVHRLVAMCFPEICGELKDGMEVNHKDCDTSNNVATNLEVCDRVYNMNYADISNKLSEANKKRYDDVGRIQTQKRIRERELYKINKEKRRARRKELRAMKKSQPL